MAVAAGDTSVKAAWLSVKGFGALAWSYLIMNAGVGTETKPDVMVQRYLARFLGDMNKLTPHEHGSSSSSPHAELNC
jgi:hypothetical protein